MRKIDPRRDYILPGTNQPSIMFSHRVHKEQRNTCVLSALCAKFNSPNLYIVPNIHHGKNFGKRDFSSFFPVFFSLLWNRCKVFLFIGIPIQ